MKKNVGKSGDKDLLASFHQALYCGEDAGPISDYPVLGGYTKLNSGQKAQLLALDRLAKLLSGDQNRTRVRLDFSDEGMAVRMMDSLVSVKVPFSFERSSGRKEALKFDTVSGKNRTAGAFDAANDQAALMRLLAEEMKARGKNALQARASRSFLDRATAPA